MTLMVPQFEPEIATSHMHIQIMDNQEIGFSTSPPTSKGDRWSNRRGPLFFSQPAYVAQHGGRVL